MNQNSKKDLQKAAAAVADHFYQPSDYTSESATEQGLAATHEQVSDYYMVGARNEQNEEIQK